MQKVGFTRKSFYYQTYMHKIINLISRFIFHSYLHQIIQLLTKRIKRFCLLFTNWTLPFWAKRRKSNISDFLVAWAKCCIFPISSPRSVESTINKKLLSLFDKIKIGKIPTQAKASEEWNKKSIWWKIFKDRRDSVSSAFLILGSRKEKLKQTWLVWRTKQNFQWD